MPVLDYIVPCLPMHAWLRGMCPLPCLYFHLFESNSECLSASWASSEKKTHTLFPNLVCFSPCWNFNFDIFTDKKVLLCLTNLLLFEYLDDESLAGCLVWWWWRLDPWWALDMHESLSNPPLFLFLVALAVLLHWAPMSHRSHNHPHIYFQALTFILQQPPEPMFVKPSLVKLNWLHLRPFLLPHKDLWSL